MPVLVVSGTGTGVGKTVVTAAVTAVALAAGRTVAVLKPAQTGLAPGEDGDVAEVVRLAGLPPSDGHELVRLDAALAPRAAARHAGVDGPRLDDAVAAAQSLAADRDLVLVEGAGGLLVPFDASGWTVADLAQRLGAPVLVVAAAGLGTLNHTALTTRELAARELPVAGLVIGAWPTYPDVPGLAERSNLEDLEDVCGAPLVGVLPDRMAALDRPRFLDAARAGLGPPLGGDFDAADFRRVHPAGEESA